MWPCYGVTFVHYKRVILWIPLIVLLRNKCSNKSKASYNKIPL
jgi:hypothetical protein